MNSKNIKQYLPSKKFQKVVGITLALALVFFLVSFLISRKEEYSKKVGLGVSNKTISELIDTDTDGDGVPDWEEKLWGTDKNNKYTFDGENDYTYIENKKKTLNLEVGENNKVLTETDQFAREFFTAYATLKDSDFKEVFMGGVVTCRDQSGVLKKQIVIIIRILF